MNFFRQSPDGGAYEVLGDVSLSFLPIRVHSPDDSLKPDHEEEFLKVVLEEFKKKRPNPIVAIAPIFYGMRDWVKSELEAERPPLSYVTSVTDLPKRLQRQDAFRNAREVFGKNRVRGFTRTVVEGVNKQHEIKRLLVIIRQGSTSIEYKHGNDLCITASVPPTTKNSFLGDLSSNLELGDYYREPTGLEPQDRRAQESETATQLEGLQYPEIEESETKVLWYRRDDTSPLSGEAPKEIRDLVIEHANEHSLYIDEQHSLVYIFSNVVQVRTGEGDCQRGCGGLFIVVDNSALEDPDLTWLHQAKSLSDKLANRIIHEAQLRTIEEHALNSAITQTAARNYAHHIGAHVKMRTTPQEIKKRINELYPGQFPDL